MADPDPIQDMINQLNDMVKLVQGKKLDFPDTALPEGVDQMLDDLEVQVKMFTDVTNETLKELGLSDEEIQRRLESPSKNMKVEEKRKIRQINHLKQSVDEIRFLLDALTPHAKKSAALGGSPGGLKKKKVKRHKKRYKRLGGDDKWKPV